MADRDTPPGSYPVDVIAKILGLTERRVQQLADEGTVRRVGPNAYDLVASVQGYVKFWRDRAEGRSGATELDHEKLLKTRLDRRKKELEVQEMEGELIRVEHFEQVLSETLASLRRNLRNLPGAIATMLVGLEDARDVQDVLTRSIDDAMRSIVDEAGKMLDDDLPRDTPHLRYLESAEITSYTDLREHLDSLEQVPGIGPARASRILDWLEAG